MRVGTLARLSTAALAAGALVWAAGAAGRPAVVGGATVDIQQAPWQVAVIQQRGNGSALCGGSIIDPMRIVTAAHCVYDRGGQRSPPGNVSIRAGISNFVTPRTTDSLQTRVVASLRVHPGYVYSGSGSPDDIVVLTLDAPLDLSGPTARAIALPAAGMTVSDGEPVGLAGFGRQSSGADPDGSLNRLEGTLGEQTSCGPNNAVVLCATSPVSAVCSGDSGSALTVGTSERVLIGVASTGSLNCPAGGTGTYTNLTAPEILRFVQGEDNPPTAPRRTVRASLASPEAMQVGQTLTCSGGEWSGLPTFSFAFRDADSGATLQSGPSATYVLQPRDLGRTLSCRASATNAGGTGASESEPTLHSVQPSAKVSAPTISARRGGQATMRVTLSGGIGVRGNAQFCVKPSLKVGAQVCRRTRLVGASRMTTSLRVPLKATAPPVTVRVAVTAQLADGRRLGTTGFIRVAA